MAWHGLGWEPAFFSEIDSFPRSVLAHHYPDVPLHDDFTTIKQGEYGAIDLLVGGTPCQSFSIAGLRGGMDDDRGNLALEFIKLAQRERPQWVVWENVPGVLSSNGGRDFGSFLGALAEIGYGFAYRVCDAQYWGVAQRRRRVFVVGYLGDWRRAAAVLFERESLSGNPAPSREEGEKVAPTSGDRLAVSSGHGWWREAGDVAQTLRAQDSITKADTLYVPRPHTEVYECHGQDSRVKALGETCSTVTAKYGTGGGNVPIVTARMRGFGDYESDGTASTVKARDYKDATDLVAYGFQSTANACDIAAAGADVSPTLRSADPMAVAFHENQRSECREMSVTNSLSGGGGKAGQGYQAIRQGLTVRRLTPTECERLQGFPDGFTQIPYRNKPTEKCPDGPRYKALGNSMAVPVMKWIGERIAAAERIIS
jgi:DNA (cytosine-5)-methyltransferase 1